MGPYDVVEARTTVSVAIQRSSTLGHWDVTFSSEAVPGALAAFAGVLALGRLDISSAIVRKPGDGLVHDSFDVVSLDTMPFDPKQADELARAALDVLEGRRKVDAELRALRAVVPAGSESFPTSVDISTDSELTTGVTVRAADRLGLLHDIAATLTRHGMRTRSLTALTYGGRAHDSFRVVDATGCPPADPVRLEALRRALVAACGA